MTKEEVLKKITDEITTYGTGRWGGKQDKQTTWILNLDKLAEFLSKNVS